MASSRPRDYPVGRGSVGAAVMTGSRRETESAAAQASMTRTCLTDTGELAGARGGGRGRSRREARRGDGDGDGVALRLGAVHK